MKLLCVFLFALLVTLPCFAACAEVVPTEERIVNLPNDQGKWYLSVVGVPGNATYERAMGWFNADPQLKDLRDQVRFCVVHSGTPIFNERYKGNIKGLPTIRLQEADGTVVYEAHGSNIPKTADALYVDVSEKVCAITRPLLPWRRKMEKCPGPSPAPPDDPVPLPDLDPPAQPLYNDGPPEIAAPPEPKKSLVIALFIACAVVGASAGVVVQWKKTYQKESA